MVRHCLSITLTLAMCADAQVVSIFMIDAAFSTRHLLRIVDMNCRLRFCTLIIDLAQQSSCGKGKKVKVAHLI